MGFEVLPAIDVQAGRLASLRRGEPATLRIRAGDPVELARSFVAAGTRWIHVVDLDAALHGDAANMDTLERIAALPIRVQAGGGLGPAAVTEALARGAARAVLGAGALADRDAAARAFSEHPGRLAAGVDVLGDRLVPRAGGSGGEPLRPVLDWLGTLPRRPVAVVVTHVDRDGSLAGVDVDAVVRIADRVGVPAFASGGIRSQEDLRALAARAPRIAGAIVGRAITEGALTLADALGAAGG
jgi:phosphoribosylformimino-5-aminoimidazole carboxamide ribonucleotide (ProFAR) isomerase